jgi:hypothetical protein
LINESQRTGQVKPKSQAVGSSEGKRFQLGHFCVEELAGELLDNDVRLRDLVRLKRERNAVHSSFHGALVVMLLAKEGLVSRCNLVERVLGVA